MSKINNKLISLIVFQLVFIGMFAQGSFAPAAGELGSTAIHKDSSVIVSWATNCIVNRGYVNITDTTETYTQAGVTLNYAFFGHDTLAIGYPETNMTCVSLGDGGSAVLEFEHPIANGEGYDFAVFENGFQVAEPPYLYFLELAFVEVSSDGVHFVRFPAISETETETQIGGYDELDPTYLYNFAGKYVRDYGTPFDLEELVDSVGIDIDNITHVKVIDVCGIIDSEHSTYDSEGNVVNDPWPTAFWSCGFDLNAVGVINLAENQNVQQNNIFSNLMVWPNPVKEGNSFNLKLENTSGINNCDLKITDIYGKIVLNKEISDTENISITNNLSSGMYILSLILTDGQTYTQKLIVR